MIIPTGTDAPIYYYPFATIGLIVANVVAFCVSLPFPDEVARLWILVHGDGLHPVQWITSMFLHADPLHLIGNMLFLWCFGLVVEGKVGWWKFLTIYFAIGIVQSALQQVMMLGAEGGGSLGASGAIYGLLAIAIVWAPQNEFEMMAIVYFRPWHFEVSILSFGFLYIGWELLAVILTGFSMSSSLLHIMGTLVGFPIGVFMLKKELVDCEGYDLWSVLRGTEGQKTITREERVQREKARAVKQELQQQRVEDIRRQIEVVLKANEVDAAIRLFESAHKMDASVAWTKEQLLQIARHFSKTEDPGRAVPYLENYLDHFTDNVVPLRLHLAQIVLVHQQRPAKALRILEATPASGLSEKHAKLRQQLIRKAEQMTADGEIELADE